MSKFTMLIDTFATGVQIAELLNSHNKLRKRHTYHSIVNSVTEYFVVQGVAKTGLCVVGCVGSQPMDENFTLLKHLCVHAEHRRGGYAEQLIQTAINAATTPYVYMTIREDNIPCLNLATKMGFTELSREKLGDRYLITVGKQRV